jgi:hypothetical protein
MRYRRGMSRIPTVKRMVMFRHGIAYVERGGPADGAFELSFKRDEMNDVLKSLAVWVARGSAQIGTIAFEKPEDPEAELARRKLNLPATGTMLALLAAIKGRRVALEVNGGRREAEVVGVEVERVGQGGERRRLVLREEMGRVTMVDFGELDGLELLDASSRADLAFFVDRSRAASAGENRSVRVDVHGVAEDLRVSYVIPAPAWRVSYRIVRSAGETVLMAWGIVHNPADEDLEGISLVLTTGQPVSFVIDLYNPKNVRRAVVEEQDRAILAPTRLERAPTKRAAAAPAAALPPMMAAPVAVAGPPGAAPEPPRGFGDAAMQEEASADLADRGELFEYKVSSPVSLKRGGSAMVPLLVSKLPADKERIWRAGPPSPPDLLVSFKNASGAVLEEGPAVVYDDDVYAGEAMVPYSARGADVKLAYAKDLAVRCRHDSTTRTLTSHLRLGDAALYEEIRQEREHTLRAESDHREPVRLVFELPKAHGHSLDQTFARPYESTANYHRFAAEVPPGGVVTVVVKEVWGDQRTVAFNQLTGERLARWLEERLLDRSTFDALSHVLGLWRYAAERERERARVEAAQKEAYAKQTKLAEQLKVLKDGGAEGTLRLRYVRELEAEQDKVNACEAEMARVQADAVAARAQADAALAAATRGAR